MKTIYLLLAMVCMISCTPSTPTPSPSAYESQFEGEWYFDYSILSGDTTWQYSTNSACRVTLTLDEYTPGSYKAYGTIGGCDYPTEYNWFVDENANTINSSWTVDQITASSMTLSHPNGMTYKYYK